MCINVKSTNIHNKVCRKFSNVNNLLIYIYIYSSLDKDIQLQLNIDMVIVNYICMLVHVTYITYIHMYICQLNVIIIKYNNIQQQQNNIVQWKENFDLNLYSNNSTGRKYRQIVETIYRNNKKSGQEAQAK